MFEFRVRRPSVSHAGPADLLLHGSRAMPQRYEATPCRLAVPRGPDMGTLDSRMRDGQIVTRRARDLTRSVMAGNQSQAEPSMLTLETAGAPQPLLSAFADPEPMTIRVPMAAITATTVATSRLRVTETP